MKTTPPTTCNWRNKPASDVQPFGDETIACFLCRQEARRRRVFDEKLNRYVRMDNL
jgi:hypothetical protein